MAFFNELKALFSNATPSIIIKTDCIEDGELSKYKNKPVEIFWRRLRNKTIVLKHPRYVCSIIKSKLWDCTIELGNCASGLTLSDSHFYHCRIIAKRVQNSFQYYSDVFDDCVFEGNYHSCEFGCRVKWNHNKIQGYVKNCDFSKAFLDFCFFYKTPVDTLKLPPWPHVAVLNPRKNSTAIWELSTIQVFRDMARCYSLMDHDDTISTLYVSDKGDFFRDFKGQLDYAEIEAIIRSRPDIFLIVDANN